MKRVLPFAVAIAFVVLAGCQTDPGENPFPFVRTISAAIANSPLDICVNGQLSIDDFDTGGRTGHGEADTQRFEMATAPTGTPCENATPVTGLENINLTPGVYSTVVILPDGVSAIQIIDDSTLLPAGQGKIRVINMSEDSGTVNVTDQNDVEHFTDVAYNNVDHFEYQSIAAGTYDFTLRSPADENTFWVLEGVEIEEGATNTIFVFGRIDGVGAEFAANAFRDVEVGVVTAVP
jgi:hypothetical protein